MINRYTLQFKDIRLERQYQEYQIENKRRPLIKTMAFLGIIYTIIRGIYSLLYVHTLIEILTIVGYSVGLIIFILILKFKPRIIRWGLMISTYLILLVYIQIDDRKTQFSYQLFSALIVALQFIFIASGEFIDAVIQLVSIFFIYTVYYITYSDNNDISTILCVFMLLFLLISQFYKNAAAERSKFQLTLIDNQWDQVLQSMITQPSLIFTFDLIHNVFIFKRSQDFICPLETNQELKEFLRQSKLTKNKSVNLENFISQHIKSFRNVNDKVVNEKIYVEFERKIEEINYSIFSGPSPVIIIKIMRFQSIGENRQIQIENNSQYKYLTLLKGIYQRLKKEYPFPNKNVKGIFKTIIFRNLIENLNNGHIKQYHFLNLIQRLQQLYQEKQVLFKNFSPHQTINGQKEVMFLVLIEIFESILSSQVYIVIEKVIENSIIEMKIEAEFNIKIIQKFKLRAKYLLNYLEDLIIEQKYIRLKIKSQIPQKIRKLHFVFQF